MSKIISNGLSVEFIGSIKVRSAKCPISTEERIEKMTGILPIHAFMEEKDWELYIQEHAEKNGKSGQIARLCRHIERKFPSTCFGNVLSEATLQYYFFRGIRSGAAKRVR